MENKDLKDIFLCNETAEVQPQTKKKKNKVLIAIIVVACVLVLAISFALGFVLGNNTGFNKDLPLMIEAYNYIKEYYYKDITWNEFQDFAAAAFAGSLDQYSGMISADSGNSQTGTFGLYISSTLYNQHELTFIIPDTPNYNARAIAKYEIEDGEVKSATPLTVDDEVVQFREGDRIYGLMVTVTNDEGSKRIPIVFESADSSYMTGILNEVNSEAEFIIKKYDGNGGYLDGYYGINLKRTFGDAVNKKAFYYSYTDDIGIIKLLEFSTEANVDFEDCVQQFVQAGKKKLILDLRNNGGGDATSLAFISQYLLHNPNDTALPVIKLVSNSGGGKMVENIQYSSKIGGNEESYYLGNKIDGFEVVVLCNGGTASASEALIGALQYYNDTQIVGTKTYGKGVAQRVFTLSNGSLLYVTNGTYYVPTANENGELVWEKCIQTVGFTPSEENKIEDKISGYDTDKCVARAIELFK